MPTGYTYSIAQGTTKDLKSFILECATNFVGYNVDLLKDPFAEQAYSMEDLRYYQKKLINLSIELENIEEAEQSELLYKYIEYVQVLTISELEREQERLVTEARYQAMLDQVEAWVPPSPDHEGLKAFMLEQLTKSLEADCSCVETSILSFSEWLSNRKSFLKRSIQNSNTRIIEIVDKMEKNRKWVQQLISSLEGETL